MEEYIQKHAQLIDEQIKKFFPENLDSCWLESALGKPVWQHDEDACTKAIAKPAWELLNRGGKRWRPFLMALAYRAVGGKEDIRKFLPICELIHNGTLIIDDIEDNSDIRRGKPCIHQIFGIDIAINAGNALYYLPLMLLKESSLSYKTKVKIYELINEEMIRISFGQGMDIYWHNIPEHQVSEKRYLQMCAYKTGTLARMAAKFGAILGKASDKQADALGKFAESIGVAFQIQDDILNVTSKKWGKDFGEDITEGKKSLMVITALERGSDEDKKKLLNILGLKTKDKKIIEEAVSILEKYDAVKYAQNTAKNLVKEALQNLNIIIKDSEYKDQLKSFGDFLINREV